MASLNRGQTFGATETITNTKLHNLVDLGGITGIVNADISNAAAIAYSKLSLTGSIVNADISTSAAIAYSKLALSASIVNADIASGAAIVASKIDFTTASAIGTTSPAAGKFTTLEATSTLKLGTTNQGDILYDNGTSLVRLTPGTSGQALLSGGAGANPSWGAAGALTFISKTTVSGVTTTGSIAITNTNYYKVNAKLTINNAAMATWFRFNNDTGNNYKYVYNGRTTGGALTAGSASTGKIILNSASTIGEDVLLDMMIFPQTGTGNIFVVGKITYIDTSTTIHAFVDFSGVWNGSAAATSFSLDYDGGSANFNGNVYLYKYALS